MSKSFNIAVLPGDGIGPEVMKEAIKVIEFINRNFNIQINTFEYDIGGIAIDRYGDALPKKTLSGCINSDAILFGSVGGPKWKNLSIEKKSILSLRKHFNLFMNIRPIKIYKGLENFSSLKKNIISKGVDILCLRELTSGIYFGKPNGRKGKGKKEYAFDTAIYYRFEIERIAHIAFKLAQQRQRKVVSIDKANVLQTSNFWREIVIEVSKKYPDVYVEHMYIDNATMQLMKNPSKFDVLLCSNLFGDILSDQCAMITGSIGMLPSASLNKKNFGLYEPAGGSAPDIAGKNIANPIAQILSLALLLKYSLRLNKEAKIIEKSIYSVLKKGYRTQDLFIKEKNTTLVTTEKIGSLILEELKMEINNG
ncbi:3-isopropylmalate dehydrogenase [Candidatus Tachikawaea gelatinosa]|uniref:3-isopropylmalate dehydrogenase n=1 Tax=Candidatus Tachikawaea gelatinosa TaxID=1410383 RepID=A0A090BWE6_9ENTR|nr:3-isopropylmalate dehydrogenase [Candidatus Tachikawaea gelatinosa]BAP58471.1 3-isopropylmalate dehydrogenase [Candidatus Tachikawaea gelatinosa]